MALISISSSFEHHKAAARVLSERLTELDCDHAYIGGFAWSLLDSVRPTEDIDVLIRPREGVKVMDLRARIGELDIHFAQLGVKFYFIQQPDPTQPGDEAVRKCKNNVAVETLLAGEIGLPKVIEPKYTVPGEEIIILHPCILILTKLKRWSTQRTSTWPKALRKNLTDRQDIKYLIQWLAEHDLKIEFDSYIGKSKHDLLRMVGLFHDRLLEHEGPLMETLRLVMYPDDWEAMTGLPPIEEESLLPPTDVIEETRRDEDMQSRSSVSQEPDLDRLRGGDARSLGSSDTSNCLRDGQREEIVCSGGT